MSLFPPILLEELVAGCGVVYLDQVYGSNPFGGGNVTISDYGTYIEGDSAGNLDLIFRMLTRVQAWKLSVSYGIARVTMDSNGNTTTGAADGGGAAYTATLSGNDSGNIDNEQNRVLAVSESSLGFYNGVSFVPNGPSISYTPNAALNSYTGIQLNFGLLRNGAKQSASDYLIGMFYLSASLPTTAYVSNDSSLALDTTGRLFGDPNGNTDAAPLQKNVADGLGFLGKKWNIQGSGPFVNNPNYVNTSKDPNHPTAGEIGAYITLGTATLIEDTYYTWGGAYDSTTGLPVS